jgi:hypothetical protein
MMAINLLADAAPYIALLGVSSLVLAVVFLKYPSIKAYRRKRNLLAYAAMITVLGLIAYQAYYISLGPNYVSFSIQKTQNPIYSGQQNQFSVTCNSDGAKTVDFYMVIVGANATLQANSLQGYIQPNDTEIKIPFSFHGSGTQTKQVYFTADANVSSLTFYPSFEGINGSPMVVWVYLSEIQCNYDLATNSYMMADSHPVAVP